MVIVGFVLGTVLGSFILALAHRSLSNGSFLGRSYCAHCKHTLSPYDLLPLVSYLFLRGKCRYCHKKIGEEYFLVEVVMGVLIGFLFWQSLVSMQFTVYRLQDFFNFKLLILIFDLIFKTFFISILGVVFITDIKKMFIPDRVILPAILIAFASLLLVSVMKVSYLYYYLTNHAVGKFLLPPYSDYFIRHAFDASLPFLGGVISGLVIGGFFFLLIIVTRGKGMGGGDVKLGAFLGICLGFPGSILAVILSFLLGSIYALYLIFTGKKHFGQVIPFGPFLVTGGLIVLFWGQQIIDWYLNLKF